MRVNRGLLNWGIFLVVLGAIPLAVQLRVLDAQLAAGLVRLWPLILIGLGIGVLLRMTPLASLGGIVVAAVAGLLVGSILAGGLPGGIPVAGCAGTASNANLETRSAPFAGNRGELDLELSCVDLAVSAGQADEWLVRADFSGERFRLDQQPARLELSDGSRGFVNDTARRRVEVSLPTSPFDGVAADITLNASTGELDLEGATLNGFGITLNASDVRIDALRASMLAGMGMTLNASSATLLMPEDGSDSAVSISLNASSLTLCVAPDLDLRINASETLSSNNFGAAGLTKLADGRWHVGGGGAGELNLGYSGNVSSITLDRSGGCQ